MPGPQPPPDPDNQLTQRLDIDFALQAAGLGVWEVDALTNTVNWDDRCRELFGLARENRLPYEQAIRYIHPDDVDGVNQAVLRAINPQSRAPYDMTYRTLGVDDGRLRWVRFQGRADFSQKGELLRFMGIAQEVTGEVLNRQKIEETQRQLLASFNDSPVGIAVISQDKLTFTLANPFYGVLTGRAPEQLIGKPLLEALPELSGQGFDLLLEEVFATGVPYMAQEVAVQVMHQHQLETIYIDFTYQPQANFRPQEQEDRTTSILVVCVDVTQQVLARRKVEEQEASLRNTIELAELGTFSVEVATNVITISSRLANWFGFEGLIADAESFIGGVGKDDQQAVRAKLVNALQPDSDGRYDVVHSVIHAKTGHQRIIHALGQVYADASGQAVRLEGTAQDITKQQEIQLVLEQQVQERTEELAAANEELAASNEELLTSYEEMTSTNEQIGEANNLLSRSNDNLQQFAYVASHDLQEPLRKIQAFGDLLIAQFGDQLGEGKDFLKRMQDAAGRMSILIRDLLAFSRISTHRDSSDPVALNQVVSQVVNTLELTIEETRASITVETLPVIAGDALQLEQLFQNLLSNALKFQKPGQDSVPVIAVTSRLIMAADLPPSVHPVRLTSHYHRIDVADNGLGFDEQHLGRIFQVFHRLHSKQQYAGTGIGLAICERVAANHGGAITASSQPGRGATFSVYLPV